MGPPENLLGLGGFVCRLWERAALSIYLKTAEGAEFAENLLFILTLLELAQLMRKP